MPTGDAIGPTNRGVAIRDSCESSVIGKIGRKFVVNTDVNWRQRPLEQKKCRETNQKLTQESQNSMALYLGKSLFDADQPWIA